MASTVLMGIGVAVVALGVYCVLASLIDVEAPTPAGAFLRALNRIPAALWRIAGLLRVQWVLRGLAWALDAFMNKPNPVVQLLYVGIVGGAFGAFYVKGFPAIRAGNPYFAARHLDEATVVLVLAFASFLAASFLDPGVVRKGAAAAAACDVYPPDGILYPLTRADCSTCKAPRPARSKHCKVCDRCVLKFDHHWCVCTGGWREGGAAHACSKNPQ